MAYRLVEKFLKLESASGLLLLATAILALLWFNSPWQETYHFLVNRPLVLSIHQWQFSAPSSVIINDGLMTFFFLLVGLEIKRELIEGELNTLPKAILPGIAALGGMIVPALIYLAFNYSNTTNLRGWAIPSATDIAFALGVVALLGKRVPIALKVFLTALAILDDLGAIIIIAIFYTAKLNFFYFALAVLGAGLLAIFNRCAMMRLAPYLIVGFGIWWCILHSGIHPTLAGVITALAIPLQSKKNHSPLKTLENRLHPWSAYLILPLFAFANAGVSLAGAGFTFLQSKISLGIAAGLWLGKQLGVFGSAWLAIKLGFAKMPQQADWRALYGVALLCGIGFTMSLFIGDLAFGHYGAEYIARLKLGVLAGSILSGISGYVVLLRKKTRST